MKREIDGSVESVASVAAVESKADEREASQEEAVARMREFARRVVEGECKADLFGLGDGFIDNVVSRAYRFYRAKSFDNAETLLRGVIALDDTLAYPHLLLGDILLQRSAYDEALAQFERAQALNPDDGETLAKFGEAKLRAGEAEEANRYLLAAMDVLPSGSRHHKRSSVLQSIARRGGLETEAAGQM